MADATKPRRRRRAAQSRDEQDTSRTTRDDDVQEDEDFDDEPRGRGDDDSDERDDERDDGFTLTSELKDTIRDAAIEILRPVARSMTKKAAKAAVTKGPDLVKDRLGPMLEDAGGAGGLAKDALGKGGDLAGGLTDKLPGVGGGDQKGGKKPTGHGRGRRLPVQEFVDVAVPIDVAYDQFTQFEEFPKFMHRVEKVEQKDDSTLMWHENIWGVRRSWEAEIVEQTPCERLVWRSNGGTESVGVVTFHKLSDQLTRVYVNFDFQPKGLFEKTASGMRMSRRALRSDLMRFKAFVEMRNEPTGAWRGMIEDGEVSEGEDQERDDDRDRDEEESDRKRFKRSRAESDEDEEDEDLEDDEEEDEEPVAEEDDELEDEEEEEPEAEEDEDWAEEDEDDEEEEERPKKRRQPARKRAAASSSRSSSSRSKSSGSSSRSSSSRSRSGTKSGSSNGRTTASKKKTTSRKR